MSNVYLILKPFSEIEAGTLLRHDNGKLIDMDNPDISIDFKEEIPKDWIELATTLISSFKEMDKSDRVTIDFDTLEGYSVKIQETIQSTSKNIIPGELKDTVPIKPQETIQNSEMDLTEPSETANDEGIIQSPTNIFLRHDSVLNMSAFNDKDNKCHLVKIRWKKDIYGYWTKSYLVKSTKYVAVTLLPAFLEIVSKDNPECQFQNKYFEENKCGVIVDEDYVEQVEENLIFLNKGSIIDMRCAFKQENCSCNKIAKGEYVKFVNVKTKEIGTVKSCHQINGQHCLKVQLCNQISAESECYIRSEDVIKQGLKQMTKYYEGVLIDPSSIYKMEAKECETRKVGDQVMVVRRDSGQVYDYSIVWLGQVNDVDVAAVQSISEIINPVLENLMFAGTFQGVEYFNTKTLLVPLSLTMKISLEVRITPTRIQDIVESLKHNSVTNDVFGELKFIHDHIHRIIALPDDCCTSILKLCSVILTQLKRDVISLKLKSTDKATVNTIENNQKLLLDCSLVALNILSDISLPRVDIVTKISRDQTLTELLEYFINETYDCFEKITNMEQIFTSAMFLCWQIVKNCVKRPDISILKMLKIFNENKIHQNIKLYAALIISFISLDGVEPIVKYLQGSYRQFESRTDVHKFSKNDLLIGLGKIYDACALPIVTGSMPNLQLPSESTSSPSEARRCIEERYPKEECGLTDIEYEKCIEILIDGVTDDNRDHLFTKLRKMKNAEIFHLFMEKQEIIDLTKYPDLFSDIRYDDVLLKIVLRKGHFDAKQYKPLIDLAESLFYDKNTSNIEDLLKKIGVEHDGDLDTDLLSLAYTSLKYSHAAIYEDVISKCKDKNAFMCEKETFLTYIIGHKLKEEDIIKAIEFGKFDVKKVNGDGKSPLMLANTRKLPLLGQYLLKNGADPMDLFNK